MEKEGGLSAEEGHDVLRDTVKKITHILGSGDKPDDVGVKVKDVLEAALVS